MLPVLSWPESKAKAREKIGGLWPLPARRRIEGMQGQVLLPARQAKGHSKTLQGGSLGH